METPSRPRTILITGAASGIGAAFVDHYARKPHTSITALDKSWSPEQLARAHAHANVTALACDLTQPAALAPILARHAQPAPDLVIHSAGVRGLNLDVSLTAAADVAARETYAALTPDILLATFNVNCVGAFNLFRGLAPGLLQRAVAASASAASVSADEAEEPAHQPPKVVVIGSRMGSLARNTRAVTGPAAGGAYAYRASKAALNALVRSFAVDVPGVLWVVVHSGRVATGLVPVREEGATGVEESVRNMAALVDGMGVGQGVGNGRFVDQWGVDIEW